MHASVWFHVYDREVVIKTDSSICYVKIRLRERIVVWSFYKLTSQATTGAQYGS